MAAGAPAQGATLRVEGFRAFMVAIALADKESKKRVRDTFRKVGEAVRTDATRKFSPIDTKTALGYRTIVRTRGISVEQKLRKSGVEARRRPKFGDYQLDKALEPALAENERNLTASLERAMDEVADHFNRGL